MSDPPAPNRNPHDGRLMLGIGGLLFIPLAARGAWYLLFIAPRPQAPVEWTFRILLDELALLGTLFFSLGFLWAISGSPSLKWLLDVISVKFAWFLIPPAILLFGALACILILV
jgi:hypothetical protein